jgi:hypothetical protein
MKKASIYKDDKGYILIPVSKTVAGFEIGTDPQIRVYNDEFEDKMVNTLLKILYASRPMFLPPSLIEK